MNKGEMAMDPNRAARHRLSALLKAGGVTLLGAVVLGVYLSPLLFMVVTVWGAPLRWPPAFASVGEVWEQLNFPRLLLNTTFYAVVTEVGVLISCTLVAYGFARFRFRGRDLLFAALIVSSFLPGVATIIPTYAFFNQIGWVGTWLPLIVPAFFANALNVFLIRQYFMTLPRELDESAMMDGAGLVRILWSIILPQSLPVLITVAVFHVIYAWNDYFGPLIYLSSKPELQPVSVAVANYFQTAEAGRAGSGPGGLMAAALLALAVPVLVYLAAQRYFFHGVVIAGIEK